MFPARDTLLPLLSAPTLPSAASRSKKSCHSSANDSLLLELLAMSMGSAAAALKLGVDGVRLNGDKGRRRLPLEVAVPGRARPACSFCSATTVSYTQIESDMMELEGEGASYHPSTPTTH